MSCKVTPRQVQDVTILDCAGRLTKGMGVSEFREKGQTCLYGRPLTFEETRREKGKPKAKSINILVNLSEVSYVDCEGLGQLVSDFVSVRINGGNFKLLNPTERVKVQLHITRLHTVFEVFDNETEAIASFPALAPSSKPYYEDRH